jgi:hypothetical protein
MVSRWRRTAVGMLWSWELLWFLGGLVGELRYGPAIEVNGKFTSVPLLVPPPTDFLMAVGHVSEG